MTTLTLYRGIAVPEQLSQATISQIQSNGLSGTEGKWQFELPEITAVRVQMDSLLSRPDLTCQHIFGETHRDGICASGTAAGAEYYALRHNFTAGENNSPIVIAFTASLDEVYVDGRDFLCTAVQLWDRHSRERMEQQAAILSELFGPAVHRYFAAACETQDQSRRIALCNLAAFDAAVVQAHIRNNKTIRGRHRTLFQSAFFVTAPIDVSQIRDVYVPERLLPTPPDITLDEFLSGARA